MEAINTITTPRVPWNKGKLVGQKAPFKPKEIWAIRVRLQIEERTRELALFNPGIESKLRGCDLTALRVRDICQGEHVAARAIVLRRKTQRPVQFEITAPAREAVEAWIRNARLQAGDFLFPSRIHKSEISARASTPASFKPGCSTPGSIRRATVHTQFAGPRQRSSTGGPRTFALFSCFSVTVASSQLVGT